MYRTQRLVQMVNDANEAASSQGCASYCGSLFSMSGVIGGYISQFSGSFSAAVLVWPLFSLLLTVPILVYLYRRDGWLRLTAAFAVYAAVLYGAGLACFTLYPLPTGDSGPGITYGVPPILDPFNFVHDVAQGGLRAVLQLLFNVALFVPLGFIANTLLKLKLAPALGISFATTCLIETAQLTGLFGMYPYAFRTFDVDDLICNTLGGAMGWALGYLANRLIFRGQTEPPPVTRHPGFVRRCVTFMTDALIIDACAVAPRIIIVVALHVLDADAPQAALDQMNVAVSVACFAVAFAVVEVLVPWRTGGSTPAGMFYRMSCETEVRTGANRVLFYALRAVVLLLVLRFPLFVALPLMLFYLVTRKMPYDFMPANGTCDDAGLMEAKA